MDSNIINPVFELNTFTTKNYIPEKDKKSGKRIPGILVLLILIAVVRLLFAAASALNIPKFVIIIILLLLILIPSNMIAKKRVQKLKETGYFDKNVDISEINTKKSTENDKKDTLPEGVQPVNIKFFSDSIEIEFPKKEIEELMPAYETNKMMFDAIEGIEINEQIKTLSIYGDIETKTYHYYPNGDINPNTLETKTENSSCWFKIVGGEEERIIDAIKNNTPFDVKILS